MLNHLTHIKNNLNLVPKERYVVLIAFNPTDEAYRQCILSYDEGFWNHQRDVIDDNLKNFNSSIN
jgi:hypothetical protein